MLLALSVISSQGASLGPTAFKVFDTRGGSIGRVEANDWVLPDPEKVVSSRHASVRCVRGVYYLEDTSTNGTFVNGLDRPVSKTQPAVLKDGDHLLIGDYEILVQLIDDGTQAEPDSAPADMGMGPAAGDPFADAARPAAADPFGDAAGPAAVGASGALSGVGSSAPAAASPAAFGHSAPIAAGSAGFGAGARAAAAGAPTSARLPPIARALATPPSAPLLDDAGAAPDALAGSLDPLALLGGPIASNVPASASSPAARVGAAAPAAKAAASFAPVSTPPPAAPAAAARSAPVTQNFSNGAGAPGDGGATLLAALGLDPARVPPEIYQQLGQIVRIVVDGLIEVLHSRAEVKNSFRLAMTNMRPVENNPLKFSMNSADALHNLFIKKNPGYLGAVEAFQEGFQDIAFHQMAMLAGIRAAYDAMLEKFNPATLEEIYERRLKRGSMLNLGGRTKYWELYRGQFEDILKDREAHFQLLFGEEFAKAYHEQLRKLAASARARQGGSS